MKKITITNELNRLTFESDSSQFENDDSKLLAWRNNCIASNCWGLPERILDYIPEGCEDRILSQETKTCEDYFTGTREYIEYTIKADYVITETDLTNDYDYLLEQCYKNRIAAYGSYGDQLDEIYKDISVWRTRIAGVKITYPKPE